MCDSRGEEWLSCPEPGTSGDNRLPESGCPVPRTTIKSLLGAAFDFPNTPEIRKCKKMHSGAMFSAAVSPPPEISEHLDSIWSLNYRILFSKTQKAEPYECDLRSEDGTRLNSSHKPISYAVFCLKKQITRCIHITRLTLSIQTL